METEESPGHLLKNLSGKASVIRSCLLYHTQFKPTEKLITGRWKTKIDPIRLMYGFRTFQNAHRSSLLHRTEGKPHH